MKRSIQESRDKTQTYFDIAEVIFLALNPAGEVTFINRKGCKILGYEEEEIIGKCWFEHFLPADCRSQTKTVFEDLVSGRAGVAEFFTNPVRAKSGEEKIIAWHNAVLTDGGGDIVEVLSSGVDITERVRADKIEHEREKHLQMILDCMVDGLITMDERGTIESLNNAAERMFGYSAEELIGEDVGMLMPEPFRRDHEKYVEKYLQTGKAKIIGIGREVQGLRKDGTVFPLSLAVNEMQLNDRRIFIGNLRDLSEEKRLMEQVYQTEKLSSLGELAAGIAHEIGGPLSVVSGNAEFLKESMVPGDPRLEDVDGIIRECDAVATLIRRLLDFSRPTTPEMRPVDINESLRNVYFLVHRQIEKESIELKLDLQVGIPPVMGDPGQLEQVFMNLVLNARHALVDGGVLSIRSYLPPPRSHSRERFVCVGVSDTGVGIREEVMSRIFEPYFTTRLPGKGTGLGLAICRRIVTDHRGRISVRSRPGEGSTFSIELPACTEEAP